MTDVEQCLDWIANGTYQATNVKHKRDDGTHPDSPDDIDYYCVVFNEGEVCLDPEEYAEVEPSLP